MTLMAVALAGWINRQQQDVIEYPRIAASGLVDCFATTTGRRHEINDSNFWTLRRRLTLPVAPGSVRGFAFGIRISWT